MMHFELEGPFVPYVRMTRRGKYVKERAQEYMDSQDALAKQFAAQMDGEMIPRGVPLEVRIGILRSSGLYKRDIDNEIKAIFDAAQGIVFEDDRWINKLTTSRALSATGRDVIFVNVEKIE